jgi:ABC-type antimicrobial peptide transport system permease subunit
MAGVLTRLLRGFLYGVAPLDPLTFALAPLTIALIALAACAVPARRALKIDPMTSLREE